MPRKPRSAISLISGSLAGFAASHRGRRLRSPLLLAALTGPLWACTPADPALNPPPSEPPARLASEDFAVEFSPADSTLALWRRQEVLLRFPTDAIQIGTVAKLDDSASYDPYWMEYGEELFPPSLPETLQWHTVTAARFSEHSGQLPGNTRQPTGEPLLFRL